MHCTLGGLRLTAMPPLVVAWRGSSEWSVESSASTEISNIFVSADEVRDGSLNVQSIVSGSHPPSSPKKGTASCPSANDMLPELYDSMASALGGHANRPT